MQHFNISSPFIGHYSKLFRPKFGYLGGKRLAIKDVFDLAGTPTSAGNPHWLASHDIPEVTAKSVQTLTEAGACIVGKTITDELAYSLDGKNIHYGSPVNDAFPEQLPGGSSSGSAIAVANDLADIGLGTDTGGSIRVPASYNGLFGLRPTWGKVSVDGVVPLAPDFDTVGWMTQSLSLLTDVARVLINDAETEIEFEKIVVLGELTGHAVQHQTIRALQDILPIFPIACTKEETQLLSQIGPAFSTLQGYQIWQNHGDWYSNNNVDIDPSIEQRLVGCQTISQNAVDGAQEVRIKLKTWMDRLLEEQSILVIPTTPGAAPLRSQTTQELSEYRKSLLGLTAIAGLCGFPQLHIPCCEIDDRPAGISFIGPRNSDLSLLALAETCFGEEI